MRTPKRKRDDADDGGSAKKLSKKEARERALKRAKEAMAADKQKVAAVKAKKQGDDGTKPVAKRAKPSPAPKKAATPSKKATPKKAAPAPKAAAAPPPAPAPVPVAAAVPPGAPLGSYNGPMNPQLMAQYMMQQQQGGAAMGNPYMMQQQPYGGGFGY